jgi:hypothetical protein
MRSSTSQLRTFYCNPKTTARVRVPSSASLRPISCGRRHHTTAGMRAKYLLQCLLAASWLATGALAHGHAAGGHHSFPPATRRLAGAGPMRRRCAVGEKLTSSQRLKRERNFYVSANGRLKCVPATWNDHVSRVGGACRRQHAPVVTRPALPHARCRAHHGAHRPQGFTAPC